MKMAFVCPIRWLYSTDHPGMCSIGVKGLLAEWIALVSPYSIPECLGRMGTLDREVVGLSIILLRTCKGNLDHVSLWVSGYHRLNDGGPL